MNLWRGQLQYNRPGCVYRNTSLIETAWELRRRRNRRLKRKGGLYSSLLKKKWWSYAKTEKRSCSGTNQHGTDESRARGSIDFTAQPFFFGSREARKLREGITKDLTVAQQEQWVSEEQRIVKAVAEQEAKQAQQWWEEEERRATTLRAIREHRELTVPIQRQAMMVNTPVDRIEKFCLF